MQDNAGQQYLPGFWYRVAGDFVQGHHMAYSSASDNDNDNNNDTDNNSDNNNNNNKHL